MTSRAAHPRRSDAIFLPDAASVSRMCVAIEAGAPIRIAAMAEGSNAAPLKKWMAEFQSEGDEGGQFSDVLLPLARAHARMIIGHAAIITAAARGAKSYDKDGNERQGDWRASAWYLGRVCPEFRDQPTTLTIATDSLIGAGDDNGRVGPGIVVLVRPHGIEVDEPERIEDGSDSLSIVVPGR